MEELKPCPFCGGEADCALSRGRFGWFVNVECEVCGAETKSFSLGAFDEEKWWESLGASKARKAWNRRVERGAEKEASR